MGRASLAGSTAGRDRAPRLRTGLVERSVVRPVGRTSEPALYRACASGLDPASGHAGAGMIPSGLRVFGLVLSGRTEPAVADTLPPTSEWAFRPSDNRQAATSLAVNGRDRTICRGGTLACHDPSTKSCRSPLLDPGLAHVTSTWHWAIVGSACTAETPIDTTKVDD